MFCWSTLVDFGLRGLLLQCVQLLILSFGLVLCFLRVLLSFAFDSGGGFWRIQRLTLLDNQRVDFLFMS